MGHIGFPARHHELELEKGTARQAAETQNPVIRLSEGAFSGDSVLLWNLNVWCVYFAAGSCSV